MDVTRHMNRRRVALAGLGFALVAGVSPIAAMAASEQQAKDMVAKAIALYDEKGEAALAVFNEGKASGFADGEIYIVVQSRGPDAKVVAHAADPKLVGTPLKDIKDPQGVKFGEEMSAKATAEGAWFDYTWPDPATGKLAPKRSWYVLHDNLVFISGIYVK